MLSIRRLEQATPAEQAELNELLLTTVNGGASIGFLAPLAPEVAQEYWRGVLAALGPGLVLWVAEQDGHIVGSVQLAPSLRQNGLHRADLQKLIVHPRARGQGVSSRLLHEVEQFARSAGCTLLVLDSEAGSKAESVYQHHQWQRVGEIPGYARDTGGVLRSTVVYYKTLTP
ncbi:GNAT family N-acetyltransferase [Corallococcus sp. BB11-1]|uniref:GNAT family N-acetyltransferase n=1 Tax=Corallococcus sp. BB11-1 TaxID=2996783 RepID=UPI00226D6720|nr:GNAT family N-acetyltransferase [Corallococcus sp. BB11-1]MCY1035929.1 GNAT family N-acetyltransferase [Corallococcus sp. BB11-1]